MILKANIFILKSKQLPLFVFAGQYYHYFELFTELYLTTVFRLGSSAAQCYSQLRYHVKSGRFSGYK